MKIIKPKSVVTVDVFYYLPDYPLLVNEFLWQTIDEWPQVPRVHKFLDYWRLNIEAVLASVEVAHTYNMRQIKIL